MHHKRYKMLCTKLVSAALATTLIVGCTTMLPEKWSNIDQAYPSGEAPSADRAPRDSFKSAKFDADFADVYRAVEVSTSQANLDIENEDKSSGVILATLVIKRSSFAPGVQGDPMKNEDHYFYAITVKENGPKSSTVTIFAKRQTPCWIWSPLGDVTFAVGTFGLLIPFLIHDHHECNADTSSVLWSDTSDREMGQFMTFLRNNLLAAGLI